jgi:hypothetical protein
VGVLQSSGKKQTDNFAGGASAVTYNAAANFTAGNAVRISLVHYNGGTGGVRITGITVSGTAAVKRSDKADVAGGNFSEEWLAVDIAGGSTAVVISTNAGAGQYITCGFEERDDIAETPLDQIGSTAQSTSAAPSVATAGAINTLDQLICATFTDYAGTNWTSSNPPTGYTQSWVESDGTLHEAGSGAWGIVNSSGTKTATFSTGASMSYIAALASYQIAIGQRALVLQSTGGSATTIVTPAVNTQGSGSSILACIGRGVNADHVLPTDNKGNTYSQIGTSHTYSGFPTSGTALYVKAGAIGGTGHTVTFTKQGFDEATVLMVECPGYTKVVANNWNEDATTATNTSNTVTTTGPAMLVAFWFGTDGNGELLPAVPADWSLLRHTSSLAGNHIQAAAAYKRVTGAGTYSIVWTPSTPQGAQLWIVALQADDALPSLDWDWNEEATDDLVLVLDAAQNTSVAVVPTQPPDDAWNWDEEVPEDVYWFDTSYPLVDNNPVRAYDDAWEWYEDVPDFAWPDDVMLPGDVAAVLEQPPVDGWNWHGDDTTDELWIDDSEPVDSGERPPDDAWNWSADDIVDDIAFDESEPVDGSELAIADAWPWEIEEAQDDPWIDDAEPADAGELVPDFAWSDDDADHDDWWHALEVLQDQPAATPPAIEDGWDWQQQTEPEDETWHALDAMPFAAAIPGSTEAIYSEAWDDGDAIADDWWLWAIGLLLDNAGTTTRAPSGTRDPVLIDPNTSRPPVISGSRPGNINTARPANTGGRRS